jgi:hypothetical protein
MTSNIRHLVISRYNEQLEWMRILPLHEFDHVFIYNKGETDLDLDCTRHCKSFSIIALPNVGKCDHTYMHHILTNFYALGDVTVFLPGCCDDHIKWFHTIITVTVALYTNDSMFVAHEYKEGIRNHFVSMYMDSYESRDHRNRELTNANKALHTTGSMLASPIRPFGLWYAANFPNCDIHHVAYFGIFAVSKRHVRNRDFDSYVELYKYVNTHPNPEVGHYFERSWLAIFNPVAVGPHIYPIPDNSFFNFPPPEHGADADQTKTMYSLEDLCAILGLKTPPVDKA